MTLLGLVITGLALLYSCWRLQRCQEALRRTDNAFQQLSHEHQQALEHTRLNQDTLEMALHILGNAPAIGRCHRRLLHNLGTLICHVPPQTPSDDPILKPRTTNELTYTLGRITTLLNNSSDRDLIELWEHPTPHHIHLMTRLLLEQAETELSHPPTGAGFHPMALCAPPADPPSVNS